MLCKNCGAQVENGATHCTNCGAPLEVAPTYSAPSGGSFQDGLKKLTSGPMDQSKIMFFVSGAAFILMMIFLLIPRWFVMKVSANVLGISRAETKGYALTPFGKIGEDIAGGKALWILVSIMLLMLALAFVACGLFYIYKKVKGDVDAKKFGLLTVAIAAVIFVVVLFTAIIGAIAINAHLKAQMGDYAAYMGDMVKYSFYMGFSAYAFLVLGAVGAVGVVKS